MADLLILSLAMMCQDIFCCIFKTILKNVFVMDCKVIVPMKLGRSEVTECVVKSNDQGRSAVER